jgi:enoyl-CoA hydratase/carnithine racemase
MSRPVLLNFDSRVATITLNRPEKLNALNEEMLELWVDALEQCRTSADVDVIIVTGAGRGFCGGGDVSRLGDARPLTPIEVKEHFWQGLHRVPKKLAQIDKPVIAAINGPAYGAGVDVALQSDIRFAAESAQFRITYTMFGLFPGNGGTYFLPRIVGEAKALELFWSADLVDAAEALRIGLVNKVFPDDELMDRTLEWARKVTEKAPIPVRLIKRAIRQSMRLDLETSLDMTSSHMAITRTSRDHAEGIKAYQEKRKPKFEGR